MPSTPPGELLAAHGPALRALARSLVGEAAADDLVQDTWLTALRRPPRDAGALRSWLLRVSTRAASNLHRGAARRVARERDNARPEALPSAAEVAERLSVQRAVSASLQRLPEPYRTVLYLRFYEDLPPRMIARRTGRPVETVRSQLRRGLERLRRDLDGSWGDQGNWCIALLPLAQLPSAGASRAARFVPTAMLAAASLVVLSLAVGSTPSHVQPSSPPARPRPAPASDVDLAQAPAALHRIEGRAVPVAAPTANASRAVPASLIDGFMPAPVLEGPSYDLRLEGVLEGTDLLARLTVAGDQAATEHHSPVPVEWPAEGQTRGEARVSFPALRPTSQTRNATRASLVLVVVRLDGLVAGEARVHPWPGHYPRPVEVRLEACASLRGTVRQVGGGRVPGAEVRVDGGFRATTDSQGCFQIGGLPPGAIEAVVSSRLHALGRGGGQLVAGETSTLELLLEPLPTGRVLGRLTSRSGLHRPRGPVRLRSTAQPWRVLEATPVADEQGWSFAFDEVPLGEVEVIPPLGDHLAWSPARLRVGVPSAAIEFECQDDGPTEALIVRARAAESGAPLTAVRVTLLVDRERRGTSAAVELAPSLAPREVGFDGVAAAEVPRDLPIAWVVEADGRRSVRGTRADLVHEGDRLVAEVALELAPPLRLWFGSGDPAEGGRALEGVEVLAGESVLGRSGPGGHLVLELVFDPGPLTARLPGWRVTEWGGFEDGRLAEDRYVHHVLLRQEGPESR